MITDERPAYRFGRYETSGADREKGDCQPAAAHGWPGIAKLQTFTELKELAENPHYQVQRQKSLGDLTDDMIDVPIIDLINGFNKLPYCFILQSVMDILSTTIRKILITLSPFRSKIPLPRWSIGSPTLHSVLKTVFWEEGCLKLLKKSLLSIRKTSNSVVRSGSGKDKSILMRCKWNQTGLSVKTRQYLITRKRCILKRYEMNSFPGFMNCLKMLTKGEIG